MEGGKSTNSIDIGSRFERATGGSNRISENVDENRGSDWHPSVVAGTVHPGSAIKSSQTSRLVQSDVQIGGNHKLLAMSSFWGIIKALFASEINSEEYHKLLAMSSFIFS